MTESAQRWRGICAYDGTGLSGWQSQPDGNGVQDFLQARLGQIFHRRTAVTGAGRTDAGVHARGQAFHFDSVGWLHGPEALLRALRCGFPRSIRVLSLCPVPPGFHARFSATGKRYAYAMRHGFADPFHCRYCWSLGTGPLDVGAMVAAAEVFLGSHDFSAYANGTVEGSAVRKIRRSALLLDGDDLRYVVEGSGFLYRMVRRMVGALLEVGRGRADAAALAGLLVNPSGLSAVLPQAAPAEGLCLECVFYGED